MARLHIMREDGKTPGRTGLCGQSATSTLKSTMVVLDPMPAVPPDGLLWCPGCLGGLADRAGVAGFLGQLLSAVGYPEPAAETRTLGG